MENAGSFLPAAASGLQTLSCGNKHSLKDADITAISRYTDLTKLALEKVSASRWVDFQTLRSLKLQELSLYDCPNAEYALFGNPGGLSSLRVLRIEESTERLEAFEPHLGGSSPASQQIVQTLRIVGENLLSLPRLTKFFGQSPLIMAGIMNGRVGWIKTRDRGCSEFYGAEQCACVVCRQRFQVWERA